MLSKLLELSANCAIDFFLIGGSLTSVSIEPHISYIKKHSSIPVVLFPGSLLQISEKADGILLLQLISGRNPEFLIGNHVIAAPFLKKSHIEVIPTGYMLIDSGKISSVEYISNTKPIPAEKNDIAVATAIAGEMLGLKMIYLEAGSGAPGPINLSMISDVKKNISVPLIVGGGIKSGEDLKAVFNAGADIIVMGTAIENNISLLTEISNSL